MKYVIMSIFLDLVSFFIEMATKLWAWIHLVANCSWLSSGGRVLGLTHQSLLTSSPIHLYVLSMVLP